MNQISKSILKNVNISYLTFYSSKMKRLRMIFLGVTLSLALLSVVFITNATQYDCTNPWYNDDRIVGCEDCMTRCIGSITYNSCIDWCEGNNFCNGCSCPEGSTFDGTQCVYAECGGDYIRHENGTCICGSESCCDRIFGPNSVWDGNGTDGCVCASGTVWNGSKCLCQNDSCCQTYWGDAITDGNLTDGCACMPGAIVQNGICQCQGDYTANSDQRTCICGNDSCCQRIFGQSHFNYSATDGCECNSGTTWNGTQCVQSSIPDDGACYCNGRKLTVLEMLDTVDGECPPCPSDDTNNQASDPTPTPEDNHCINGQKDEGEEGIDCGGTCENSCEWSITINPHEVEMTADGVSSQEFTARVVINGTTIAGEELKVVLINEDGKVENGKEGTLDPKSGKTDESGEFKFVYKTENQSSSFEGGYLYVEVQHNKGNIRATIHLTKSVSILCGNWICESGENNANCKADCPKDITYEQALQEIHTMYNKNIKLNPYYPEGTASYQLYFTGIRNNFPKGVADGYLTFYELIEKGGGWVGEKLDLGKLNLSSIKKPMQKISQQYDPYTCGSFQSKITHMFDSLRWSNDATERKIISYFDYAPVSTNIPMHEAVMLYPKGTDWKETAYVLDPWLMNNHSAFPMNLWSGWGILGSPDCSLRSDYPACGGQYFISTDMTNTLRPEEQKFYDNLPDDIKKQIDDSLSNIQKTVERYKANKEFELSKKHELFLINNKSYIIQSMMYSDRFNKVEVIVDCPVHVLITDLATGKRTGIDQNGNLVNEIPDLLPDLRLLGDSELFSYFTLPKNGNYKVEMFGLEDGSANIYKSVPSSTNEFDIYEYSDISVSTDDSMNFEFSSTNKGGEITSNGNVYMAEHQLIKGGFDDIESTFAFVKNITSDSPSTFTGSDWGVWNYLLICGGSIFIIGGSIIFVILLKKKTGKIVGFIILIGSLCVGCTMGSLGVINWLGSSDGTSDIDTFDYEGDIDDDSDLNSDASDVPDSDVMGFVENTDYNFSLFLGEFASDTEVKKSSPDWALASYDYCVITKDTYEDPNCGSGMYGLFNITVFDDEQYKTEVAESPMGDVYTTLFSQNGINIVFSHPNGASPESVNIPENFYNEVIDSFVKLDAGEVVENSGGVG